MNQHRNNVISRTALGLAMTMSPLAHAQVATDGTTGPGRVLDGPDYAIGSELGTQAGGNLFHSFEEFSIRTGESATFSGPGSVENVIGRVTGGDVSSIDGRLASTIPGADLWLFNPSGVVFGPNATLDLTGSFHVSSADEVRTADGGVFSAADPSANGFSVAAPEAFGFLSADPAGVTVAGSQLAVGAGETLSVVGGDVAIVGDGQALATVLTSEAGTVNLLSAGGPGSANVRTGEVSGAGGEITVNGLASVNTFGDGGGTVRIRGGSFVVDEGSIAASINTGAADSDGGVDIEVDRLAVRNDGQVNTFSRGAGAGGDIKVAADAVELRDRGLMTSRADASGAGGKIDVQADTLDVLADARIQSSTTADGTAGDIAIDAGRITLGDAASNLTGIISLADNAGRTGDAGAVTVDTDSLTIRDGGVLTSSTLGGGNAGGINVIADEILIDGESSGRITNLSGISGSESTGNGTDISLKANRIAVINGGGISTSTLGGGAAGNIRVNVESLTVDGGPSSISFLEANSSGQGDAGTIEIVADEVDLISAGSISSSALDGGSSGRIIIRSDRLSIDGGDRRDRVAGIISRSGNQTKSGEISVVVDDLTISNTGTIDGSSSGSADGAAINITAGSIGIEGASGSGISTGILSETGGTGNAGTVRIKADDLVLAGGSATIATSTASSGSAGAIVIDAGRIDLDSRGLSGFNGVTSQGQPGATGDAGSIAINAGEVLVRNGAEISTSNFGTGDGGDISVAAESIQIIGETTGDNVTGINSAIQPRGEQNQSGRAGGITIKAGTLKVIGETAQVATTNEGAGDSGNIAITLTEGLQLQSGAGITSVSRGGAGGEISIAAGAFVSLSSGSSVATSVTQDTGNAGNITVETPLIAVSESEVLAQADAGQGGDVRIRVDDLVLSPNALISAEAGATGIDGTVQVTAPEVDLSNGLVVLDEAEIDAASLLRARCAARTGVGESSFTAAGTDGLPLTPDDRLTSRRVLDGLDLARTEDGDLIIAPARLDRAACGGSL